MALAKVGILSIGDMGFGVAKLLKASGFEVLTNVTGRSPATAKRAESAAITVVPTDADLAFQADYILSIVPPRDAVETAQRVIKGLGEKQRASDAGPLYYLDLNAISPGTARSINEAFQKETPGVVFVDGGIIGGPPSLRPVAAAPAAANGPAAGTATNGEAAETWYKPSVVLSGPNPLPDAPKSGSVLASVLNSKHVGPAVGTASGLKCTFASLSKGFISLAIQSLSTASRLGVLPHLLAEIEQHNPAVKNQVQRGLVSMAPKAYRWVDEMHHINRCFAEDGGWAGRASIFDEVAGIYKFVADETILGQEKVGERVRGKDVDDVASILAEALGEKK